VSKLSVDSTFDLNLSKFFSVLEVSKLFPFLEVSRSVLLCQYHKVLFRIELVVQDIIFNLFYMLR
jgi:hypothetical protein